LKDINATIINLSLKNGQLEIDISLWVIGVLILILMILLYRFYKHTRNYKLVKISIKLGGIGNAEFTPNDEDVQIAHKLWTELTTRKAAIEIVEDEDVIVEVYDSWYEIFTKTRELISEIPVSSIQQDSTKILIQIATDSLNKGLRPHLTKWQAKYRNWYKQQENELKTKTPQEVQKSYPEYDLLIEDMIEVNNNLINYANQLKLIVESKGK